MDRTRWVVTFLAPAMLLASAARADESVSFHAPLDGLPRPAVASAPDGFRTLGAQEYIEGVKGQALVLGGKSFCRYALQGDFAVEQGACALWVKSVDWTSGNQRFVFFLNLINSSIKEGARILLYKTWNESALTLRVENGQTKATTTLKQDIASWKPGDWHQVVFTWRKDAGLRLYVDGALAAQGDYVALPETGWDAYLGMLYSDWAYTGEDKSAFDEFTLYKRSLSAEDVRAAYDAVAKDSPAVAASVARPFGADLVFHAPMDGATDPAWVRGVAPVKTYGDIAFTDGVSGKAAVFGGKARLVIAPADSFVPAREGSLLLWAKPLDWDGGVPRFCFLAAIENTSEPKETRRILLYKIHNAPRLVALFQDSVAKKNIDMATDVSAWQPGAWRHVAVTWKEAVGLRLYVDGQQASQGPYVAFPEKGWQFTLGIPYPGWAYLGDDTTAVDDVMLLSRALTGDEVLRAFESSRPKP